MNGSQRLQFNSSTRPFLSSFEQRPDGQFSHSLPKRDPVIYRILNASHPRTGAVCQIYLSYDFAHGQCDAIGAGGRKVGATIHW